MKIEDYIQEEEQVMPSESPEVEAAAPDRGGFGLDFSFLKAKTGDGSIENYLDHPMNFSKSQGLAQVIRGFTGLFGALDLAVIDIAMGFMQFGSKRGKTHEPLH